MAVKDDYQDFKNALHDLKMNNKSSINFLTLLAEDKVHNAAQIVRAIEERILETKGDYVLPSLYVLDSIVKNLRSSTYIQLFENKLPVIFASAFNKVDERTRLAMFKLRQTWPPFFSNAMLHNLDSRTHYIDPAWPVTARAPDTSSSVPKIHINPDFIQRNPTSSTSSTTPSKPDDATRQTKEENNNNYHMIPIDRKETENSSTKNSNDEQQTKVNQDDKEKSSEHEEDDLFGGSDIDYRDTDVSQAATTVPNSDTDRLFKLNSECLSLAEQKFKSKELSSEEYQATLKFLQTILQDEVQRLTVPSTNSANNNNPTSFSNPSLSFPSTTTSTLPNFPLIGFGSDTQRHALQILAAVNATSPYALPYNFPYIPPLPPAPAPPPFNLMPNTFPSTSSATSTDRHSPGKKRTPDSNSNSTIHSDRTNKRQRRDSSSTTNNHGHNFDEENIAPVPSLVDANINTLKKKYLGVIQQLYIGKYQCRLCGLRFTAKQKHVYTHHLDWHYWENRQAATNQTNVLERCRDWYPSLQDWIVHEENLDDQIKNNQMMCSQNRQKKEIENKNSDSNELTSCSAKGDGDVDNDRCSVCHDPFENFFDDNREEWRLKDAMRVDGKTYHPVCYQDVQFHDAIERPSTTTDSLQLPESLMDESSNQSSDSQLVDNVLSLVNIKPETDETNDKESLSSPEESNRADYVSSMSFVNLVETIFIKKEDLKPIEKFDEVKLNVKEELMDSPPIPEDGPFLSIKPDNDCEFFNNQTAADQIRSITE